MPDATAAAPASAVLVAHGAPADPMPQEAALRHLAEAVAAHLPGWAVRGATLAVPASLPAALAGLTAPLIYPFFMAEGYFTGRALPERLARALATDTPRPRQLPPFGVDPALPGLMARAAAEGARDAGLAEPETTLVLAAHGSRVSSTSKDSVHAMAESLRRLTRFKAVIVGLIEEPPHLAEVARVAAPALCLPFFALKAGHVEEDIPVALARAGFTGPLLPPIGDHPDVPRLIAAALVRAMADPPEPPVQPPRIAPQG